MEALCVFCGANPGRRPAYREAARRVGELLAERGITLVYGGGNVGLMGALADACLGANGRVIGVIPRALAEKEIAHQGLSEMHVVASMHERKALMAELSDAFIAAPGGYGTLDEFCEILTWTQLGLQRKPIGMLNVDGYFDRLLALFDHAVTEQFVKPMHRDMIVTDDTPQSLIARMRVPG